MKITEGAITSYLYSSRGQLPSFELGHYVALRALAGIDVDV